MKVLAKPLQINSHAIGAIAHDLDNLSKTIADELEGLEFVPIAPERSNLLHAQADFFGADVLENFPCAGVDIVEAALCFALWRNTACVFHCMRVLEFGIQGLAVAVGIDDPGPNWEPVIARLTKLLRLDRDQINRNPSDRIPEVHDNREYYAGVSAYFNAIKIAWRNRVMHVGAEYSAEHAEQILKATRGFMEHLAVRLCETGPKESRSGDEAI